MNSLLTIPFPAQYQEEDFFMTDFSNSHSHSSPSSVMPTIHIMIYQLHVERVERVEVYTGYHPISNDIMKMCDFNIYDRYDKRPYGFVGLVALHHIMSFDMSVTVDLELYYGEEKKKKKKKEEKKRK